MRTTALKSALEIVERFEEMHDLTPPERDKIQAAVARALYKIALATKSDRSMPEQ